MKVRNKKTREIGELKPFIIDEKIAVWINNKSYPEYRYSSLEELNAEWEDAREEPKEYWYVDDTGVIQIDQVLSSETNMRKSIGNYFESKEEAEKAVEKLKAFKRLKDKGFEFDVIPALGHCDDKEFDISIIATMPAKWWYNDKVVDDIHYVFGGEE